MTADTTTRHRAHAPEVGAVFDAVVVGAGFAGMYMLHRLRGLGFSARVFEAGGGVGGTWYWNRYPGARCDVESMQYSFSFSEELDQEWNWSEKYAPQPEILSYANHVADRFDLRRHIVFDTRVTRRDIRRGSQMLVDRDRPRRQGSREILIMAVGCLSAPNRPNFKGLEDFRGPIYHTGNGRMRGSTSPACVLASSAPAPRRSSRFRSSRERPQPHGVPAHGDLVRAGLERKADAGIFAGGQSRLSRAAGQGARHARPASIFRSTPSRRWRRARRTAKSSTRKPGRAAVCRFSAHTGIFCSKKPPMTPSPTSPAARSAAL